MIGDLDDREAFAAEYVLGTLDRDRRREAEARLTADPEFAALVETWERRLLPLAMTATPVTPPPEVWPAIAAALPSAGETAVPPVVPPVGEAVEPEADGLPAPGLGREPPVEPTGQPPAEPIAAPAPVADLRRRLRLWQGTGVAGLALAAALAAVIVLSPNLRRLETAPVTEYVAVVDSGPGDAAWLIRIDTAGLSISVRPFGTPITGVGSYELWLLPDGGAAPTSLGLLDPGADLARAVARDIGARVDRTAALAISLEPDGGSPTGLPTGPVLFQGRLVPVAP